MTYFSNGIEREGKKITNAYFKSQAYLNPPYFVIYFSAFLFEMKDKNLCAWLIVMMKEC